MFSAGDVPQYRARFAFFAPERVYVEASIFERVRRRFLKRKAESLRIGVTNGKRPRTLAALIFFAGIAREVALVYDLARKRGSSNDRDRGGRSPVRAMRLTEASTCRPTIYTGLPESARCCEREENFRARLPMSPAFRQRRGSGYKRQTDMETRLAAVLSQSDRHR